MHERDLEFDRLVDQLRRKGFRPVGVPSVAAADEGLIHFGQGVSTMLVVPRFGDATVLQAEVANDPSCPSWLVRSVLTHRLAPPVDAARLLLGLDLRGDQVVS